ncbi:MAG: hypothetical protein JXA21_10260, partial [Anaerolineae bacterium]|nr:hypothetical protein [Anaerolineae bacterium]
PLRTIFSCVKVFRMAKPKLRERVCETLTHTPGRQATCAKRQSGRIIKSKRMRAVARAGGAAWRLRKIKSRHKKITRRFQWPRKF